MCSALRSIRCCRTLGSVLSAADLALTTALTSQGTMINHGTWSFGDPQEYQAAVRPAQVEVFPTTKGRFQAEVTRTEFSSLWLQRGRESLARIGRSVVGPDRAPIYFLANPGQFPTRHNGVEVAHDELVVSSAASTSHLVSSGPSDWATLSLTRTDLANAGLSLLGHELTFPVITQRTRPLSESLSRLRYLHDAASFLARKSSGVFEQPEAARAIEQALIHAMVTCLSDGVPVTKDPAAGRHAVIIARFEELLLANVVRPLFLADICAAIGVSERALRMSCQEQLGMGPISYLFLRRMHLVRRALLMTDHTKTTVTAIATMNGFWELGRFAVRYRQQFGESPSETLRRPPVDLKDRRLTPFSFATTENA